MMLRHSPILPLLSVHVNPVGVHQTDFGTHRVAAFVLLVNPGSRAPIDPVLVAATLGLTPAEGQIAVMLAEGSTMRDIAAATDRKEGTIRWHLKQIYKKQGISREVDLVRLVLSIADFAGFRR